MPKPAVEELVDAYQRAVRAWVAWAMTPKWRRLARHRRRDRAEALANRADALRAGLGVLKDDAEPLITVLDRVGPERL